MSNIVHYLSNKPNTGYNAQPAPNGANAIITAPFRINPLLVFALLSHKIKHLKAHFLIKH